ncbi:two-component regulator propeller domain-containing protein [Pontibacter chitinilyticus]|uniref:two-component regulator propeller domain-containing protein n=1 Tax=Pontibacter chitinilyticus TaxID=2674989 RepID=UPI00321A168B
MSYKKLLIVVLYVLGSISQAFALPAQYRFSLLDINNGLSNNQVKCFLKDSRGYLWIGTVAGLNRYDGFKVKTFRYHSSDSSSLAGNDVLKLFESPDGRLWAQSVTGYSAFDPVTEKFQRGQGQLAKQYKLPAGTVEDITTDTEGNYWFITTGKGITRYNPKTHVAVNLKHSFSRKSSLSTNYISAIHANAAGDIWVIHSNGILEKLDRKTLQVVERNDDIYKQYNQELLHYDFIVDSDNDLWLYQSLNEGGVFFYDHKTRSLAHFDKKSERVPLNNNMVRSIVEGEKGLIWIATDHGGINLVNKRDFSVQYIRHDEEVRNSLAHNSINTLYKDAEGIIWVGTFKKGVNFYHPNIIRFPHYKHQASDSRSLPYDDVNTFVEDDKGNLWIGTNGGGLLYYNRSAGTYTRYSHDGSDSNSVTSDIIVSLLIDRNKELWIGTYLGGLDRFDGKTFVHYKNKPNDPQSLSDNSIWELFEDYGGNVWIGTLHGGLELFDRERNMFHHSRAAGGEYPIHCDYISTITEDNRGNLWVGGGFGVDVFNKETGKSTYFTHEPANPGSLISNNIQSIHQDKYNNIWIGTSEGLDLYQEKQNTFTHFTTEDGLPSSSIISILEDDKSNLWLSTPNGISNAEISRAAGSAGKVRITFRNFDELDGLQGKVFNENAALRTSKGELIFGGPNGYNLFYPHNIKVNTTAPRILFTDFQLFNRSVEVNKAIGGRIILPKSVSETKLITLKHDENVFSVEFAALNYFHPEKSRYKYKLEGFDKEWHTVDNLNRRVTYTNLDPGKYELKVLASNNDGIWNDKGTSVELAVLAPFWRTKEAFLLYFVLGIIILVVARKLELQRARSKFLVEQQRREAQQLHELDMMKIKFLTNVSHEFRTPLSLILAPIDKLLNSTTDQQQQQQFQMINRNAKRLLNLVNQLLDFRKIEVDEISFHPAEGNVVKFVQEAVYSFSDLSEKKNIALTFHSALEELQVSFDMDKMEKILFNLLSNAFKFTPEFGRIEVELGFFDNDSSSEGIKILEIKVKDTGIGIPKEKQAKVFERFFRDDVPDNILNQGSGIGLSITKEFVKVHGGIITVDSEPGKGSCFKVSLPVKELNYCVLPVAEMANSEEQQVVVEPVPVAGANSVPVVLLVEDNEDFRFYLKDNLQEHFTIIEAKDGKEGWQKALSHMPDLIVSDLMMPQLNGIEFCQKIKQDPRTSHIPFILVTAHASEEQKLKGLNIGANDYVTKPFNFLILFSRIKNLIKQNEQLQKVFERKISVQTTEEQIVSLDDKLIQNAIKVVEENLSEPDFSVEALSKELAVSRVHLYKKMVAITGQSPVEFIRKIRLKHAAQLLEKSQLTVAEVAYKVGFNNRKYFTKYFKDEYKILPSLYAESKQQESEKHT